MSTDDLEKRLQLLEMLEKQKTFRPEFLTIMEKTIFIDILERRNEGKTCEKDMERAQVLYEAGVLRKERPEEVDRDSFAAYHKMEDLLLELGFLEEGHNYHLWQMNQRLSAYTLERIAAGEACQCEINKIKEDLEKCPRLNRLKHG